MPKYIFRLAMVAKAEEAIGRSELAITRQSLVIETLTANGQDTSRARELRRIAEEHLPNWMADGSNC